MPDASEITESQLSEHLAALVGTAIRQISYCGLRYEGDVEWDFSEWHHAEMGVEFVLGNGRCFSATWGDAFGHFHVELRPVGLQEVLPVENFRMWDVTSNPAWTAFQPLLVQSGRWVWGQIPDSEQAPIALQLTFEQGDIWIAAGEPLTYGADDVMIGMDSLMLIFSPMMAERLGVDA